jgi:hypothetical protein
VAIDAACDGGHFESGLVDIGQLLTEIWKFCCDVGVAGWRWLGGSGCLGVFGGERVAVAGWQWYQSTQRVMAVILRVVWL